MQAIVPEHLCEGGAADDSDYSSIRSGDSEKTASMALITGIEDLDDDDDDDNQIGPLYQPSSGIEDLDDDDDDDNQIGPLYQPSSDERPPLVFYHLEDQPKTAPSMDWEMADRLSDLHSGQEGEREVVLGVSPSQLEHLFFSNDYIEVMEVPTYGQVKYVSYTLYDGAAPIPGKEVTVKKSARIEPPDRLIVGDAPTLRDPPPPPIPVPEVPRLPPPKVESLPPPPPEATPPPVKEPTPPPISEPKKQQIVKKTKEKPPTRVKVEPGPNSAPSPVPMEPSLVLVPSPSSEAEVPDESEATEDPPCTPDPQGARVPMPEAAVPPDSPGQSHETPPLYSEDPPPSLKSDSTHTILGGEEDQDVIPDIIEEIPATSPVQPPTPSTASHITPDQASTESTGSAPTPGEESPHPPEEEPYILPPAMKDPEFLAQQERERLAEERRLKAYDMFDRLKARRFIPLDVTADESAPKPDVKRMIHSYDGWLAQFFIIKEDKAKMYQQVFEVVDGDGDGYLSCFETLMALKGITGTHNLTEKEEAYIVRVLELAEYPVTRGTDLRLFSVLASLSQRIVSVDDWVRNLINSLDLTSLEWKITRAKELFQWCLEEDSRRLHVGKLLLELKAGGVSPEHQEEVRATLGCKGSWDMIDFFSYLPLFIMTHTSVVDNPLDDSRVK